MTTPTHMIDLVGLTPDLDDPTSGIQYAVLDGGEYHAYGDQSWVADGRALAETHPDGRIVSRTITITYGPWEDPTAPPAHIHSRSMDGYLSPRCQHDMDGCGDLACVCTCHGSPGVPGCPKCGTILNAGRASCDGEWHSDNQPAPTEPQPSRHIGRSWIGHEIEDDCPCPQEPCGLVDSARTDPACTQHPTSRAKSMRQGHMADACPVVQPASMLRQVDFAIEPEKEPLRAGMCGDAAPVLMPASGLPPLLCDLRAGHAGWHEGGEHRTSWTHTPMDVNELRAQVAALQAKNEQRVGEVDRMAGVVHAAATELNRLQDERDRAVSKLLAQLDEVTDQRAAEATRADEAEAERDQLRARESRVWQRIQTWNDDPETRLQAFALNWDRIEAAEAERDAMRPVVEAAVAWRQAGLLGLGTGQTFDEAAAAVEHTDKELLAVVDQYLATVQTMPEPTPTSPPRPAQGGVAQEATGDVTMEEEP